MDGLKFAVHTGATQAAVTSSPPTRQPLPTVTVPVAVGFSGKVPAPAVFRSPVQVIGGEALLQGDMQSREQIQRQIEKDEIRREIIAAEKAAARRRELEEEVRRELALERGLAIPMQNPDKGLFVPQQSSISLNQKTILDQVKDKAMILASPDADVSVTKRKAMAPPVVDDGEQCATNLQKKPKHNWNCELCHVTTTSEKALNDHFRGKKHKAKETALTNQTIGFDPRPAEQNIQKQLPNIIPADTGMVKSGEEGDGKQENEGLGGREMENEIAAEKEVEKTSASTPKKKFRFWCALCEVHANSEAVMHTHKVGKKHLANLKKASQTNGT